MRSLFFVVLSLLTICCQSKSSGRRELSFTENSVGSIMIGQPREEVLRLLGTHKWKEVDWAPEGEVIGTVIEVYEGKELLFSAEIYKGSVYRLNVMSPQVRTRDGIGVGSTLGEIKKRFGSSPRLLTGEDGLFAVFMFKKGVMSFGLDVPEPFEKYASEKTKVRFVLITNGGD